MKAASLATTGEVAAVAAAATPWRWLPRWYEHVSRSEPLASIIAREGKHKLCCCCWLLEGRGGDDGARRGGSIAMATAGRGAAAAVRRDHGRRDGGNGPTVLG